jgi:hypothetical protein
LWLQTWWHLQKIWECKPWDKKKIEIQINKHIFLCSNLCKHVNGNHETKNNNKNNFL